jgi:hypothetical protein
MERRSSRIAARLALISTLVVASCAKSEIVFVDPTESRLTYKLRLSEQEWQEIQAEFQKHRGDLIAPELNVKWWGRSLTSGLVEVGCVDPKSPASGPIFFFRRDEGHWHILREMTVWYRN